MVDTIVLRYHGILSTTQNDLLMLKVMELQGLDKPPIVFSVPEHNELYRAMVKYKGRFFHKVVHKSKQGIMITDMEEGEYLKVANSKVMQGFEHIREIMRFEDQGKVKEVNMRINGKFSFPSSVSSVVYTINENAGFIDFSFSIPKYLFGHSLAEFIPQGGSGKFSQDYERIMKQKSMLYDRLIKFIKKFNNDLQQMFELECELNMNYIEIRRLDLCYNQHFDSKAEALNYLEQQKKLVRVKSTKTANRSETFDSSLTYITSSGSYFKIYHKGTEYSQSNGDLKKHQKFNEKYLEFLGKKKDSVPLYDIEKLKEVNGWIGSKAKDEIFKIDDSLRDQYNKLGKVIKNITPFDVLFLKAEMDKVLRYEVSLRGDWFDYTYKRKIFRKDCEYHQRAVETYDYVHKIFYNKGNDEKVGKSDLMTYKMMNKWYNRSVSLMVGNISSLRRFESTGKNDYNEIYNSYDISKFQYRYSLLANREVGSFTEEFLGLAFEHFWNKVRDFQPKKLQSYDEISKRIKQYNDQVKEDKLAYNQLYHVRTLDHNGKSIIKGNKVITKATQLLTEAELRKENLKLLNGNRLLPIIREMEKGKSLNQVRDEFDITTSNFSRIKADLEKLEVFEQSFVPERINVKPLNFREYYFKTAGWSYQDKFYFKLKYYKYG